MKTTLSSFKIGSSGRGGSFSRTSSPAPAIQPSVSARVSAGWLVPRSAADYQTRRNLLNYSTDQTLGMWGRPPDYGPTFTMGFIAEEMRLEEREPGSAAKIEAFIEHATRHNLTSADLVTEAQSDRSAPAAQNRITGRRERPSQPVSPAQRIAQMPELCDAVNRCAKSQNVQMTDMKLEQRYENVEQYILLENRKLNQLVSLPLLKGPEYRLTVYGARGEVLVVEIRFEKRTWVFLVKFLPVLRRG